MKKWLVTCFLVTVLALISVNAIAQEAIGLDVDLTYASKYIWRGMDLMPDDEAALSPSITYGIPETEITLNAYGYYNLDASNLDEIDYTIDYTTEISEGYDLSAGLIYYWLDAGGSTYEAYAGVTLTDILIQPSLTIYYDFDEVEGFYANLAGAYEVPIDEYTLCLGAGIGYFNGYGMIDDGLGDIDLSASMAFDLSEMFTLTPEVHYVIVDEATINSEDEFWFGVTAGASF